MAQRTGIGSRALWAPEVTVDSDAGVAFAFVLPVATDGVVSTQPLGESPVFTGDGSSPLVVPGMISVAGDLTLGLEFLTLGYLLKAFLGSAVAPVSTGAGQMHYFPLVVPPTTGQLQKEWAEAPKQVVRNRATYLDNLRVPVNMSGPQLLTVAAMAFGDELNTATHTAALADILLVNSLTATDLGYVPASSFNGMLVRGGLKLATVANFQPSFSRKLARQDAAFNAGIASGINAGLFRATGPLDLIFDTALGLSMYNDAILQTHLGLETVWCDAVVSNTNAWLHIIMPEVVFERRAPAVGTEVGIIQSQSFRNVGRSANAASGLEGFLVSGLGPFVIGANNKLAIKIDGGADQLVTLVAGTRSAQQIVADITALPLVGGTADVFPSRADGSAGTGGRFRIKTATKGTGGSVAIHTGVANDASAILGLDATVRAGKAPASIHVFLFNNRSTQYT